MLEIIEEGVRYSSYLLSALQFWAFYHSGITSTEMHFKAHLPTACTHVRKWKVLVGIEMWEARITCPLCLALGGIFGSDHDSLEIVVLIEQLIPLY